MNISEKNAKAIAFILIISLLLVFYFIPYKKLDSKKTQLENEVANLQSTYNILSQDISKKDEYLKGINKLKLKIVEMDETFPAELTQEMMLYTLDDMEKTIGIKIPSASFSILLPVFDDEALVNEEQAAEAETETDSKEVTANEAGDTETAKEESVDAKKELAVKCEVTTSTVLTYSQLKDLMDYLYGADGNNNKNRTVMNNLSLTSSPITGELNASFSLSFYALYTPDRIAEPLDLGPFDLEKEGVFLPFDEFGVSFTIDDRKTQASTTVDKASDFFMMLSPITADQTTVSIGQTSGTETSSMVLADSKNSVDVQFEFNQKNGKYFFRYKAGADQYPENYAEGVAFIPGNALELLVLSNKRNGDDDNSGANVTIINNTDMPLSVLTSYEDKVKPRFKLIKAVGDVKVK